MSISKLKITYTWDKATYLQGSKSLYEDILRHSPKRFVGWFFIALSQFGLVAYFKKGAFGLLLISTVFLIYWYILRWPLRKLFILHAFKKSPLKNKEIIIELDDKKIIVNDILIPWSDVQRVLLEDKGFLLYYRDNYIFIPKSAFDEENEKSFLNFIKSNLKTNIVDDRYLTKNNPKK